MLKTLLVTLLLAGAAPAFAQTAPAVSLAAKTPQYEHCILVLFGSDWRGEEVRLEFGQGVKNAVPNPELTQANAAVRKLASVVLALNYMSSQGWECINVTTFTGANGGDTGYLLRRAK